MTPKICRPSRHRKISLRRVLTVLACFVATVWLWLFLKVIFHRIDRSIYHAIDRVQWYYGSTLEASQSNWTIFYHVFVPRKGHKNALEIAAEQLEQIKHGIRQFDTDLTTFVYYTTNGDLVPELKNGYDKCRNTRNLECRHLQHLPEGVGNEIDTLQVLYDFCQNTHPDHIVTYLHTKGSFHKHKVNNRWRLHLTNAAVHPDCYTNVKNNECNLCGFQFFTLWANFVPGNMWTARCGYIKELLSPGDFPEQQEQTIAQLLWLRHRGALASRYFEDRLDRFGLDRYGMEHWIGSHPHIKPCDMAPSNLLDFLRGKANESAYAWGMGPRQEYPPCDTPPDSVLTLLQSSPSASRSELFYLPGRLRMWYSLYQTLPAPDSWVWFGFPDGSYWRDQVEDGSLIESWSKDTFYEPPERLFPLLSLNQVDAEAAPISIFTSIDTAQAVRESQVRQITSLLASDGDIQLFYYQDLDTTEITARANRAVFDSSIRAKPLPNWDRPYEGGILQGLHEYCQLVDDTSPDNLVLYLPKFDAQVVKKLLECSGTNLSGTCNVCGGRMFIGSVLHFHENTWIAKCSYIKALLHPHEYTVAMNRAASRVWLEALKDRFKGVPQSAACLGTDASALFSWVTSHPDVVPCHLPDVPTMPLECENEYITDRESKDGLSLRTFAFLAGHLWRWNFIYQQVPSLSSWVWTTFPDGDVWRNAVVKHGREQVVEAMTRKFANTTV